MSICRLLGMNPVASLSPWQGAEMLGEGQSTDSWLLSPVFPQLVCTGFL